MSCQVSHSSFLHRIKKKKISRMLVRFKALIFLCLLPCSTLFALLNTLNPILKQTTKLSEMNSFQKVPAIFPKESKEICSAFSCSLLDISIRSQECLDRKSLNDRKGHSLSHPLVTSQIIV